MKKSVFHDFREAPPPLNIDNESNFGSPFSVLKADDSVISTIKLDISPVSLKRRDIFDRIQNRKKKCFIDDNSNYLKDDNNPYTAVKRNGLSPFNHADFSTQRRRQSVRISAMLQTVNSIASTPIRLLARPESFFCAENIMLSTGTLPMKTASKRSNPSAVGEKLNTSMHFLNLTGQHDENPNNKQKRLLKDVSNRNIKDIFNSHFINNDRISSSATSLLQPSTSSLYDYTLNSPAEDSQLPIASPELMFDEIYSSRNKKAEDYAAKVNAQAIKLIDMEAVDLVDCIHKEFCPSTDSNLFSPSYDDDITNLRSASLDSDLFDDHFDKLVVSHPSPPIMPPQKTINASEVELTSCSYDSDFESLSVTKLMDGFDQQVLHPLSNESINCKQEMKEETLTSHSLESTSSKSTHKSVSFDDLTDVHLIDNTEGFSSVGPFSEPASVGSPNINSENTVEFDVVPALHHESVLSSIDLKGSVKKRMVGSALTPVLELKKRVESSIAEIMRTGEKLFVSSTTPRHSMQIDNAPGSVEQSRSSRSVWGANSITLSASKKNALIQSVKKSDRSKREMSLSREEAVNSSQLSDVSFVPNKVHDSISENIESLSDDYFDNSNDDGLQQLEGLRVSDPPALKISSSVEFPSHNGETSKLSFNGSTKSGGVTSEVVSSGRKSWASKISAVTPYKNRWSPYQPRQSLSQANLSSTKSSSFKWKSNSEKLKDPIESNVVNTPMPTTTAINNSLTHSKRISYPSPSQAVSLPDPVEIPTLRSSRSDILGPPQRSFSSTPMLRRTDSCKDVQSTPKSPIAGSFSDGMSTLQRTKSSSNLYNHRDSSAKNETVSSSSAKNKVPTKSATSTAISSSTKSTNSSKSPHTPKEVLKVPFSTSTNANNNNSSSISTSKSTGKLHSKSGDISYLGSNNSSNRLSTLSKKKDSSIQSPRSSTTSFNAIEGRVTNKENTPLVNRPQPTTPTSTSTTVKLSNSAQSKQSILSTPTKDSPLCEFYPDNSDTPVTPYTLEALLGVTGVDLDSDSDSNNDHKRPNSAESSFHNNSNHVMENNKLLFAPSPGKKYSKTDGEALLEELNHNPKNSNIHNNEYWNHPNQILHTIEHKSSNNKSENLSVKGCHNELSSSMRKGLMRTDSEHSVSEDAASFQTTSTSSSSSSSALSSLTSSTPAKPINSLSSPFKTSPRYLLLSAEKRNRDTKLKEIAISCDNILNSITKINFQ